MVQWALYYWAVFRKFADFQIKFADDTDDILNHRFHPEVENGISFHMSVVPYMYNEPFACYELPKWTFLEASFFWQYFAATQPLGSKKIFHLNKLFVSYYYDITITKSYSNIHFLAYHFLANS